MSFHFYVKNNTPVTFSQVLTNKYVPKQVAIAYEKEKNEIIQGFSKLYIPLESSRGVVITKDDDEYDIELNTGASETDYYLATRVALALGELNNSDITDELGEIFSADGLQEEYTKKWAQEIESYGINALIHIIQEHSSSVQLNGCKRAYYFGEKMLQKLTNEQHLTEAEIAKNIVEDIKQLQFIEDIQKDIHVPTLMEADFIEGTQSFISVAPNFRLLLIKADCIILRNDEHLAKFDYEDFIELPKIKEKLHPIDEEQFIMESLSNHEYQKIIKQYIKALIAKEKPKKSKSKWKFWK
ncbi:hypothetical protein C8N46_110122 [Kordia periserrulae]|uniref:Uncharacterized protein n=1 Tax=Kordia periserrulae TaxID=701523 RepID=A0A2T6BT70_9FLAO|nr:DUF4299 family protein [Kordia periserrulae]PTX59285.1 hypothetical protein C8N46_110122 [Kordia periserrulae]